MTTQRDRLAAVLADAMWGEGAEKDGEGWKQRADALLARGVRVVNDPARFDQDERDAEAEERFLQPINPDPVTRAAEELKPRKR